jgi:hypothetical protein
MRYHDTKYEKKNLIQKKIQIFWEKLFFFIIKEKAGFLKKIFKFMGSWYTKYIYI